MRCVQEQAGAMKTTVDVWDCVLLARPERHQVTSVCVTEEPPNTSTPTPVLANNAV